MKKQRVLRILAVTLTALVLIVGIVAGLAWTLRYGALGENYHKLEAVKVGMTEKEVITRLGQPHEVYYKATAPRDYYRPGYSHKQREISNKVFIYSFGEAIAYYYLNEDNKVEDTFVGGS